MRPEDGGGGGIETG